MSKKESTREHIIKSFWEIYEEKRIEKITVKDICQIAGIHRSTFYEYFTDVYDVLETVENSLLPTEEMLPQQNSFDIQSRIDYFHRNKRYLRILLSENGNPSFRFKLMNYTRNMIDDFMKDKDKPKHFDYILEYSICGMIGILSYHICHETQVDEEELLQTILNLSSHLLEI